jgi:hypothetical protein
MGYFLVVKSAPAVWQPWPWLAELIELGLGGSWDGDDGVCGVDGGEADGISPCRRMVLEEVDGWGLVS